MPISYLETREGVLLIYFFNQPNPQGIIDHRRLFLSFTYLAEYLLLAFIYTPSYRPYCRARTKLELETELMIETELTLETIELGNLKIS